MRPSVVAMCFLRGRGCWLHDQHSALVGTLFLAFALWSGATALDTTGFWALEVVRRDPRFVIAFGASADGRALSINFDGLGLLDRPLALWLLLLELREIGNDPDVVEGVSNTNSAAEEEDVEEDPELVSKRHAVIEG